MKPNQQSAYDYLAKAQHAMKSGDWNTARHLAEQASYIAPELEEVWLLMGALSAPPASTAYLEKALNINPNSERAIKGLIWARSRMEKEQEARAAMRAFPVQSQAEADYEQESSLSDEYPTIKSKLLINARELEIQIKPVAQREEAKQPSSALDDMKPDVQEYQLPDGFEPQPYALLNEKKKIDGQRIEIFLIVLLSLYIIGVIGWRYHAPILTFFRESLGVKSHAGPAWAEVNIPKSEVGHIVTPGLQSRYTATLQPPAPSQYIEKKKTTPTSQHGAIVFTLTPLPTDTPSATISTPAVTSTSLSSHTNQATSIPDFDASPTPLPTDTDVPAVATKLASETSNPSQKESGGGGIHWIDVDLTNQMLYAYEGDTLVNSFLVSTGTWLFPTVTGAYHVYGRIESQDMSGPGYYLPNVPFIMYFYQDYAIHGTYWHSNFGTPMSHGCVNMETSDAEWIYNWSSVGTLINIHY